MNRITRRMVNNKDFNAIKLKANNAFSAFKDDTKQLSSQFTQLFELFNNNDSDKILDLIDDMISTMDVMSTNLSIVKNNMQKELTKYE